MSTATLAATAPPRVLAPLARREIVRYAKNPLFWIGGGLTLIFGAGPVLGMSSGAESTTMGMILPAALLGVVGLIVMAGLTRSSDRAAAAAGAVAVSQRTRTLALAGAVVVPLTVGLVWWVLGIAGYYAHPPKPWTVPFAGMSDAYIFTVMFALGAVPCVGGPLLGLVIGRWLPQRGVAPVAAVVLVLVTILLQGNFESTRRWRLAWVWTYFYGQTGWDDEVWKVLTGSPYIWVGYLLALCVLGVLVALYKDAEAERSRLRALIALIVVIAAALTVTAMFTGYGHTIANPVPHTS